MTKFSFEVPLNHLNDFEEDQDFFFTLSILYKDSRYARYVRNKMRESLKPIWLDNSFNETFEPGSVRELLALQKEFNAVRVILPDSVHWSLKEMKESVKEGSLHFRANQCIIVCKNLDWYRHFRIMTDPDMKFAISYHNRPNWSEEELKEVSPNTHYLGLNSIAELIKYKPISCDTSMPIKLALIDQSLSEWIWRGCPHIHTKDLGERGSDFFNMKMTIHEVELAKRNIKTLKERVNGQSK